MAENFQNVRDHFKQVRTIFENDLFLEVSQILSIRTIQIKIGKNNWDSENYRKSSIIILSYAHLIQQPIQ